MPMLFSGRAERHISRMHYLYFSVSKLMVSDTVRSDEDLSAFMGVPVIDDARIKYDKVKARRSCGIILSP